MSMLDTIARLERIQAVQEPQGADPFLDKLIGIGVRLECGERGKITREEEETEDVLWARAKAKTLARHKREGRI